MLAQFQAGGLLQAGGRARTDSTHILAAVRDLNRLECVGETLRAVLNDVAVVAPDWLRHQVTDDWFGRYGKRIEESRLPTGKANRSAYAEQIGADGFHVRDLLYHKTTPRWLRDIPTVEILRQTWVHQYSTDANGHLRLRQATDLPPARKRIDSPYDPEAHCGKKRSMTWTGSKVHVTETCDAEALHGMTHVETTEAAVSDVAMTAPIHQAFVAHQLTPDAHVVDAGSVDAALIVQSLQDYHIELIGPVRPDVSWQAQHEQAYDISQCTIAWESKQATCPQGKQSSSWTPDLDQWHHAVIRVKWLQKDCGPCESRAWCTKAKTAPRHMTIRPEQQHNALQTTRQLQTTPAWKSRYDVRAGREGTLSQGLRGFGLRQCR